MTFLYTFVRMIKMINQWNLVSYFDLYIPLFLRGSMFMKPRFIHFEEHLKKIWELATCSCKTHLITLSPFNTFQTFYTCYDILCHNPGNEIAKRSGFESHGSIANVQRGDARDEINRKAMLGYSEVKSRV